MPTQSVLLLIVGLVIVVGLLSLVIAMRVAKRADEKAGRELMAWREENAGRLGTQLRAEFGPLSPDELNHIWDVVCQGVAVNGIITREQVGMAVVYAREKTKPESGSAA